MKGRVIVIEDIVREHSIGIKELKADITVLKADMKDVKADVKDVKQIVGGHAEAITELTATAHSHA